jgi:hypothetical protein
MKLCLVFLLTILTIVSFARAQPGSHEKFWDEITSCKADSDCHSAVEIWPACNHICGQYKHENCSAVNRVCPALSKTSLAMPDCAVNAPCTNPKRIWCQNGHCKSE